MAGTFNKDVFTDSDGASLQFMGQEGSTTITTTNAFTKAGGWFAIQIITDTVFTTLTDAIDDPASDSNVTGITYPAGLVLYGKFTAITLASGQVRAYLEA